MPSERDLFSLLMFKSNLTTEILFRQKGEETNEEDVYSLMNQLSIEELIDRAKVTGVKIPEIRFDLESLKLLRDLSEPTENEREFIHLLNGSAPN